METSVFSNFWLVVTFDVKKDMTPIGHHYEGIVDAFIFFHKSTLFHLEVVFGIFI